MIVILNLGFFFSSNMKNVFKSDILLVENVALNKTAYQTNPYRKDNDFFDASNAVDSLKSNLHWTGGQCAVSALKKETATWWVDLGSIHSIHHITLYYRTDNTDWGKIKLLNVIVYFSRCLSVRLKNTAGRNYFKK